MRSVTVGHKLLALAAVGLLVALSLGAVAWWGTGAVRAATQELDALQDGRALVLRLDTRAGELEVDGFTSLVRPNPEEQLEELAEDVATPRALVAELKALGLSGEASVQVEQIATAYDGYIAGMEEFVAAAIDDQRAQLGRFEEVQAANDVTDEAVGTAVEVFTAAVDAQTALVEDRITQVRTLAVVACGLGLAVLVAVGVSVQRSIVPPLHKAMKVLAAVADGDLTPRVNSTGTCEVAQLSRSLDTALDNVGAVVTAVAGSAQTLAAASEELASVANVIAASAEETSAQSNVVAAAAEQVSRNVQTVATGSEEMGASIREIAHNTNEAARVAGEAAAVAESTNATVSKLGESSTEIGNVVKVITSIAEQTNLLALNATIEAARAGEAGKGFVVVANEVKELAQEMARATKDISRRVEAIQTDTTGAVTAIGEVTSVIARINDFQATIASAVEEQTATTNEMNRNVSEAAMGSGEIAANITGVATAAQVTTEGIADSQRAAGELARLSSELQALVNRFTY